jgi:hypothetical protein
LTNVAVERSCVVTSLSVVARGRYLHGGTSEQVTALIDEVLAALDGGNPWVNLDCGEAADFYFAPTPLNEDTFAEPPFD